MIGFIKQDFVKKGGGGVPGAHYEIALKYFHFTEKILSKSSINISLNSWKQEFFISKYLRLN